MPVIPGGTSCFSSVGCLSPRGPLPPPIVDPSPTVRATSSHPQRCEGRCGRQVLSASSQTGKPPGRPRAPNPKCMLHVLFPSKLRQPPTQSFPPTSRQSIASSPAHRCILPPLPQTQLVGLSQRGLSILSITPSLHPRNQTKPHAPFDTLLAQLSRTSELSILESSFLFLQGRTTSHHQHPQTTTYKQLHPPWISSADL